MKKIFKLVIVAAIALSLCGCSGGKKPSDYYDLLKENNYQILISFDYTHYYNEDLDCYGEDGKELGDVRLLEKPSKYPIYLLINKNKDYTLTVYFDKDTKRPSYLYFSNEDGSYGVNFKDKTRNASVMVKDGTNYDHCTVDYEGDSGETKCPSKQVKIADSVKKEYEGMFEDLEIKEEDLMDTFTWFNEEKMPTIKKELTDVYNKQKPLTNDEVIEAFEKNKFLFVEDSDGSLNFKYISSLIDTEDMTFTALMDDDGELFGIVFLYGLYYEPYDESIPGMMYCYYVEYDKSIVMSIDGKYIYNLSDEKSTGDLECDEDFIERAGTYEFVFEKTLDESYITKEELINFFKTYKN